MRSAFMAAPYVAVLIGLYWLHSAWLAILLYHAAIGLFIGITRPPGLLHKLKTGWHPGVGSGLSICCACAGPAFVLLWPLITDDPDSLGRILASFGLGGASLWIFALYFATVHPVIEEAFWRVGTAPNLRSITFDDLAFAGYHFLVLIQFVQPFWAVVSVVVLTSAAWLWRLAAARYGGLAVPVVSHAVSGISIMAATIFLSR